MDDATSAAILEVQIGDINELISEAMRAKTGNSNEPSEWEIALKIHKEELVQGLSIIRDCHLSHSLARAVMIDSNANNEAIAAAIAQERPAENDRTVALRLAGLPVPSPIQQALAGLGTPTPPQTPTPTGIPPRQQLGGGAAPTPPQTPQGHGIAASRPGAHQGSQRSAPASNAANQSRQQTSQNGSLPSKQSQVAKPVSSPVNPATPSNIVMSTNPIDKPKPPPFVRPGSSLPPPPSTMPTFAPATKFNPWSLAPAKKKSQLASGAPVNASSPNLKTSTQTPNGQPSTAKSSNISPAEAQAVELASKPVPTTHKINAGDASLHALGLKPTATSATSLPVTNKQASSDKGPKNPSPVTNDQPISKDRSEIALQSTTGAADGSCTLTRLQKRKFDGERDHLSQDKRIDMGDKREINSGIKRRREDDENSGRNPNKRRDTGSGKIIDLTGDFKAIPKDNDARKQSPPKDELKSCVCCAEDFESAHTSQMPCKRDYCHFCVQRIVINSLVDEALYPPRCCKQPFDMDSMRQALTLELISDFYEKKAEFETVDRAYCSNPICSTFLYPVNIVADTGTCPKCLTTTCVMCKAATHKGNCPQDTATQQVLELANTEGWKRCEHCKRMIELKHGCNHIT
ncbi:hypothetical protein ACEPPN_017567 [Leptodophora sp. 'Broadleaf-Isolate-01']